MPQKSSGRRRLTRQEQRDLDVEIGFLEGLVRRDPGYVDALQILGDDYTRRGRFAAGLEVDERLCQLRTDDPIVHYNLACSYSLTKQPEQAAAALHRALDLGFKNLSWVSRDPDLNELRRHPLYEGIRARVRSLQVESRQASDSR